MLSLRYAPVQIDGNVDNDHVAGPIVAAGQWNLLEVEREVPRSHQGFLINFVIHVIFVFLFNVKSPLKDCINCHTL